MASMSSAEPPPPAEPPMLPWADKVRFQKLFSQQAVRSYLYLSLGMGLLAFLLPLALLVAGGYSGHYSISAFYHAGDLPRNMLVGSLWAIGVFLFLFQGLSRWENWLLNLAGIAAIAVAMFPMPAQQCAPGPVITVHAASAITFFLCLAAVAIGFSKTRVRYIIYPAKRQRFRLAYDLAGLAMIAMPTTVYLLHRINRGDCASHWIFWVEVFGIWAFAAYWFVKTFEYRTLLRVRWRPSIRELRARERAWADAPKD